MKSYLNEVNIDISNFQYLTLFVSIDGRVQICPTTRFSVFEEAHVVDRSGRRNKMEKRRLHMQAPLSVRGAQLKKGHSVENRNF